MMTPDDLFLAIRNGDADAVLRMVENHPQILNQPHPSGLSPILFAAYHERLAVARLLAERKVILDFFEAIALGYLHRTISLLTKTPGLLTTFAANGSTPLSLAAYFGQQEVADYLLRAGAWVNRPDENNIQNAPLHHAAAQGYTRLVVLLLQQNGNPNQENAAGETPLMLAAQGGHLESVRALLFYGADMSLTNQKGKTALDMAQANQHAETVALLRQGITRRFKPVQAVRAQTSNVE